MSRSIGFDRTKRACILSKVYSGLCASHETRGAAGAERGAKGEFLVGQRSDHMAAAGCDLHDASPSGSIDDQQILGVNLVAGLDQHI